MDIFDLNVIMHAPNAYQIYFRIRKTDFSDWKQTGSVVMVEVFTDGPSVFIETFKIEKGFDFELLTQAKGMYLSMRFAAEGSIQS